MWGSEGEGERERREETSHWEKTVRALAHASAYRPAQIGTDVRVWRTAVPEQYCCIRLGLVEGYGGVPSAPEYAGYGALPYGIPNSGLSSGTRIPCSHTEHPQRSTTEAYLLVAH
eukprot:3936672-Rhodomonas_salina.1